MVGVTTISQNNMAYGFHESLYNQSLDCHTKPSCCMRSDDVLTWLLVPKFYEILASCCSAGKWMFMQKRNRVLAVLNKVKYPKI